MNLQVNLKLTRRALANEHLPVWIANGVIDENNFLDKNSNNLQRNYEVMKHVGKFSLYHQPETSSSAVYFHKRREFDGIIDHRVIIRGLPVKFINPDGITYLKLDKDGIYQNQAFLNHVAEDSKVTPVGNLKEIQAETFENGVNDKNNDFRTFENRIFDGYPEILVVVDWNTVQDWTNRLIKNQLDLYGKIVSYIITLFNGVDMLYSKLRNTKIQINIAGIIIESAKNTFLFLNECYLDVTENNKPAGRRLDAACAIEKFEMYLKASENTIQSGSYDCILFITSNELIRMDGTNGKHDKRYISIKGLAGRYENLYKEYIKKGEDVKSVATIQDNGQFESMANVAHEIGHTMTALHDTPLYYTSDGKCCGYIMKPEATWCMRCLGWSPSTEETFKLFFSSPNCCALINKPRSLLPQGPYEMLTPDEQCQCYGYMSAAKFGRAFYNFCKSRLKCESRFWKLHITGIPMDGTPCDDNKVCWDKECENIDVSND
ncbi:hypothetical protein PV326_005641 [Microctonus aethiopoides]|nr:hypothetical protein PV326_005641 [Microctonus aethiopoides]